MANDDPVIAAQARRDADELVYAPGPSADDIYTWAHNTSATRIAALEADIAELRAALAAALPLMQYK